jgi:hypothetical protein
MPKLLILSVIKLRHYKREAFFIDKILIEGLLYERTGKLF